VRAREPDLVADVQRDGVRLHYEVHGDGPTTVLLLPTWSIMPSRFWKAQVPYLARHARVVVFDGRGTGRSSRPVDPAAYAPEEFAGDALAVLDATGTGSAVLVGLSLGAQWGLILAAGFPHRVLGLVAIAPAVPLVPPLPDRAVYGFEDDLGVDEGWARYNRNSWVRDFEGFLQFFFRQMFPEPHSTKQIEDCVGWGLETGAQALARTVSPSTRVSREDVLERCSRVTCPVLVVHGDADQISSHGQGVALAAATGGTLLTIVGGGHGPHARDPVAVNQALRRFVQSVAPPEPVARSWTRAPRRDRRVLYLSSPIGLGHTLRDIAIVDELRKVHPGVQVDWLAQHPVTAVLEQRGERVHPASAFLSSEAAHVESESGEHDLHAFQAIRRMDEVLVANFMVFADLVEEQRYDLWVGDEAWDLDHFLHENPELKTAAYAWMTDFVGWLPMPSGGPEEALLTADYNAEMIQQRSRHRHVRDRSIFVGNPDDVVPDAFGPHLPGIREWTEQEFDFSGYVTGFDPGEVADRAALREELGYGPDERVCVVTVGGSGVGAPLLRRILACVPEARERVPGLRTVVVTGPRIDPGSLPQVEGVEVHGHVPRLYRHLAACDLAVVQGGLTTCMELTAQRRPFLYVPLRNHFEQNVHVRHRLDRYRAGRCLDYAETLPGPLAEAIAATIGASVDYRPVETDGAERAAAMLAGLL
jgi:pimeloyl-ACP methyl ester carboxylesterase/predicted glycosyltransferase